MKDSEQAKTHKPNKSKTSANPVSSPVCYAEAPELQEEYKDGSLVSEATDNSKKAGTEKQPD
ncbi:MAG: hypothetical protein RIG77_06430 [Cyclobacteriaceae bacterium]